MVFSSTIFIFAFLPLALAGYYLIRGRLRNLFLLGASLFFYAYGQPAFVLLLLANIALNYAFALIIDAKRQTRWLARLTLAAMLIFNLGLLFMFKYLASALSLFQNLSGASFILPSIALPLGISFFTFRSISYVLDVYFETEKAQRNPVNVALYISFFPQLTMGPIMKYHDFSGQLENRTASLDQFATGAKRFITGLAKKVILSNGIAFLVDSIYAMDGSERGVLTAWLGAFSYLLQLYYDFSGYSDMAVGLSSMFGFRCMENFNYPYITKSIREYWNRWHISLSTWLRDYLYTPVFRGLMDKRNPVTKKTLTLRQCDTLALLVTWICNGVWHGAGLRYLLHGLYWFAFILYERGSQNRRKEKNKRNKKQGLPPVKETRFGAFRAHVYAIAVLVVGQVLFRADSMGAVIEYYGSMLGLRGNAFADSFFFSAVQGNWIFLLLGVLFCMPVVPALLALCEKRGATRAMLAVAEPLVYAGLLIVNWALVMSGTYQSFIYFQF